MSLISYNWIWIWNRKPANTSGSDITIHHPYSDLPIRIPIYADQYMAIYIYICPYQPY